MSKTDSGSSFGRENMIFSNNHVDAFLVILMPMQPLNDYLRLFLLVFSIDTLDINQCFLRHE